MLQVNCKLCRDNIAEPIDEYKFHVESDVEYFGKLNIYYCDKCDFGFSFPDPDEKKINYFYQNIYRSKGRPHETTRDLDSKLYNQQNFNYIEYLTTFINFNKINNVFDFGSGSGDLCYLLKQKFSHLNIATIENDRYSRQILEDRKIKVFNDFDEIKTKYDLVISTHVLEHLTDLEVIDNFKKISGKNSLFFFEVPNNQFKKNFMKRPYDSPHLLFFTEKSLEIIRNLFNLELVNKSFYSNSLEQQYHYMDLSKKKYRDWQQGYKLNYKSETLIFIKNLVKKLIPKKIMQMRQTFIQTEIAKGYLNDEDSWCLRVIFKNN
tara:strand:- start:65 stop:1024 length:960 start_codon:yes stop_codon:yes gene_type:complete